ncbi:MAG: glycosyltransferase family 4 protein, partial [Bdellovibrionales bacterium]|nr:glycosyltransferase family 4 protein [Bdellovibrionales bacterium]
IIPNAVDTEKFQPRPANKNIRKDLGVTNDNQLLVGLIGRLDKLKGHEEFIEAVEIICSKHENIHFVMIGANTAFEGNHFAQHIHDLIDKKNLRSKITLTEHRTDIPQVMNSLDIFCMPSYEENFGNVLLEALASGTPSVGTNSGGTPEIIKEGHTGVLVGPCSGPALAGGLLRLIESTELRNFIGQNARAEAIDRFQIETVFRQIENLLTR